MKRNLLPIEERQSRELLLQDFEQWRAATGSTSRANFAQSRGLDLGYFIIVLKWYYEACKRDARKKVADQNNIKPKSVPSLVAVTKKAAQIQPTASSAGKESAILIMMKASIINIAGHSWTGFPAAPLKIIGRDFCSGTLTSLISVRRKSCSVWLSLTC
ncbi:MAG TPA: hypothetical protein VJ869_10340 [Sphaerochaeta sp.]|nr:hypothetical protein [Sphaerochaeta sp.]